jgi:hypothetical protein
MSSTVRADNDVESRHSVDGVVCRNIEGAPERAFDTDVK